MKVLVECSADEVLLKALGVPKKQLLHFGGKDKVISRLRDLPGHTGMVDQDPASIQHPDLRASYRNVKSAEGLHLLLRQGGGGQKLILLCPKLEDWLIDQARSSGLRLLEYGLPDNPDRLHSIPRYEEKNGFRRFIVELMDRGNNGLNLLREWVHQQ